MGEKQTLRFVFESPNQLISARRIKPSLKEAPGKTSQAAPKQVVGWALIGAGAASVVLGSLALAFMLDRSEESKRLCPQGVCSNDTGLKISGEGRAYSTTATIGIGFGLLFGAGGVVVTLWPKTASIPK
jgi:hypothetical protein